MAGFSSLAMASFCVACTDISATSILGCLMLFAIYDACRPMLSLPSIPLKYYILCDIFLKKPTHNIVLAHYACSCFWVATFLNLSTVGGLEMCILHRLITQHSQSWSSRSNGVPLPRFCQSVSDNSQPGSALLVKGSCKHYCEILWVITNRQLQINCWHNSEAMCTFSLGCRARLVIFPTKLFFVLVFCFFSACCWMALASEIDWLLVQNPGVSLPTWTCAFF